MTRVKNGLLASVSIRRQYFAASGYCSRAALKSITTLLLCYT